MGFLTIGRMLQRGRLLHRMPSHYRVPAATRRLCSDRVPAPTAVDNKFLETPFASRMFTMLDLHSFNDEELHAAFEKIDLNHDGVIEKKEVRQLISDMRQLSESQIDQFTEELWLAITENKTAADGNQLVVTEEEFLARTRSLASNLDYRVWPITGCFFAAGCSIGVMIPVMPLLATQLDIGPSGYGAIVGAFAGAKMVANLPAAYAQEKLGLQPLLVYSTFGVGVSIFGISLCSSFEELIACRAMTGVAVASFVTAATTYLAQVSTPLNRARTMAPPMMAFSSGAALGPAVGGVLADVVGVSATFGFVGLAFGVIGASTHVMVPKLKMSKAPAAGAATGEPPEKSQGVLQVWRSLLSQPAMAAPMGLNAAYWLILSGSQMTILPLYLVGSPNFDLSTSEIGGVFAMIAGVGMLGTPIAATLLDKFGKVQLMIPAAGLMGGAMALVPFAETMPQFLTLVSSWTLAGTVLATGPTAHVTELANEKDRGAALALLRTVGDVGMLGGAIAGGVMAGALGQPDAIAINGGFMVGVSALAAFRLRSALKG